MHHAEHFCLSTGSDRDDHVRSVHTLEMFASFLFSFLRLKCSEFLLLYSENAEENCGVAFKSNIQEDLKKLFGEKCASFICSMNLFSSALDSQVRQ